MRFSHRFLVLLLMLPMLILQHAEAQEPQKFRIVIADTINLSSDSKETLDITTPVTEAIYREFTLPVKSMNPVKFFVFSTPDIMAAAKRLGITTRTEEDYLCIAEELKADLLLKSESVGSLSLRNRHPTAAVSITILDVSLRIPVGLGLFANRAKKMPQAVERAVKEAMRQSWELFWITANVVSVAGENVVVDRGYNDGLRVGDKFVVYRESNGKRVKSGIIGTARAYHSDAEADILIGTEIRRGDKVVRIAERR